MTLKKNLRKQLIEKRKHLSLDYRQLADAQIFKNIIALNAYQTAGTIFCFVSMADEVNTRPILEHAINCKKRVTIPKCMGKGIMHAFQINTILDLELSKYGIWEPKDYCKLIAPEEIDFAIVPCLSCNLEGYRIGYGGGYYDRYLAGAQFKSTVICYKELMCEDIPVEKYDVKVNVVVTD